MKILFILLIFISSLYSQYVVIPNDYTKFNSICFLSQKDIYDYGTYYTFTNVAHYGSVSMYKSSIKEIKDGYDINPKTGKCEPIFQINGMTEQDFNFAMAIYGVALSSLIGFGLIRSIS